MAFSFPVLITIVLFGLVYLSRDKIVKCLKLHFLYDHTISLEKLKIIPDTKMKNFEVLMFLFGLISSFL